MKLTLRDACADDARAVAHLYTDGWKFAYQGLMPQTYLDGLNAESRIEYWEKTLSVPASERTSQRIVACDERGSVRGIVSFGAARNAEPSVGEIYTLYVHP